MKNMSKGYRKYFNKNKYHKKSKNKKSNKRNSSIKQKFLTHDEVGNEFFKDKNKLFNRYGNFLMNKIN